MGFDEYKNLIIKNVEQVFKETFYKLPRSNFSANATRNHTASTADSLITSLGLGALAYICLIFGCVGSQLVLAKKKEDSDVEIETFSLDSVKKAPLVASCFLFGLFVLMKYIDISYIIKLMIIYMIQFTMCNSYVVIEECIAYFFNKKMNKYSIEIPFFGFFDPIKFSFSKYSFFSIPACLAICVWYVMSNKFWISNNTIAMLITIYAISFAHMQKLIHGVILLSGLLVYDIFWVYGTNVMVSVAIKFDAPIKLLFPNDFLQNGIFSQSLSLLGLGDIVVPGIYIAFLYRYDTFNFGNKRPFFNAALVSYGIGFCITNFVLYYFKHGQPALLYLVPALFVGTIAAALKTNHVKNILEFDEEMIYDSHEKVE